MAFQISTRRTGEHLVILLISGLTTQHETDIGLRQPIIELSKQKLIQDGDTVLIYLKDERSQLLLRSALRGITSAVQWEVVSDNFDYSKHGFGHNCHTHPYAFVISHPLVGSTYQAGDTITATGRHIDYRQAITRKRL